MRNKFPGTCYRCGGHVAAGEGHFERKSASTWRNNPEKANSVPFGQHWLIQHANCAIEHRGTNTLAGTK